MVLLTRMYQFLEDLGETNREESEDPLCDNVQLSVDVKAVEEFLIENIKEESIDNFEAP